MAAMMCSLPEPAWSVAQLATYHYTSCADHFRQHVHTNELKAIGDDFLHNGPPDLNVTRWCTWRLSRQFKGIACTLTPPLLWGVRWHTCKHGHIDRTLRRPLLMSAIQAATLNHTLIVKNCILSGPDELPDWHAPPMAQAWSGSKLLFGNPGGAFG